MRHQTKSHTVSCFWSHVSGLMSVVAGFSLVEIVISLGILSVGLVGAMRVFPVGLQASARSEMSSRATMAAQRTLESLKLKSCETLADEQASVEEFTVTTRIGQPVLEHLSDPTRLKTIETAVTWTQAGRPKTLTFVTYVRCQSS